MVDCRQLEVACVGGTQNTVYCAELRSRCDAGEPVVVPADVCAWQFQYCSDDTTSDPALCAALQTLCTHLSACDTTFETCVAMLGDKGRCTEALDQCRSGLCDTALTTCPSEALPVAAGCEVPLKACFGPFDPNNCTTTCPGHCCPGA